MKQKYKIEIVEQHSYLIEVEAENEHIALNTAIKQFESGEFDKSDVIKTVDYYIENEIKPKE